MNSNGPATASLPASFGRPDIVRRFLAWAQRADAEERAQAASALARAYLYSDLTPSIRTEAALAMTTLLDDPSPLVRRALAEALAQRERSTTPFGPGAGRGLLDVAAAVLQRSACVDRRRTRRLRGDRRRGRPVRVGPKAHNLSPGVVTAALAEVGGRNAIWTLIGNRDVDLWASPLGRIFARFGDNAEVREALVQRPSLPADLESPASPWRQRRT